MLIPLFGHHVGARSVLGRSLKVSVKVMKCRLKVILSKLIALFTGGTFSLKKEATQRTNRFTGTLATYGNSPTLLDSNIWTFRHFNLRICSKTNAKLIWRIALHYKNNQHHSLTLQARPYVVVLKIRFVLLYHIYIVFVYTLLYFWTVCWMNK